MSETPQNAQDGNAHTSPQLQDATLDALVDKLGAVWVDPDVRIEQLDAENQRIHQLKDRDKCKGALPSLNERKRLHKIQRGLHQEKHRIEADKRGITVQEHKANKRWERAENRIKKKNNNKNKKKSARKSKRQMETIMEDESVALLFSRMEMSGVKEVEEDSSGNGGGVLLTEQFGDPWRMGALAQALHD